VLIKRSLERDAKKPAERSNKEERKRSGAREEPTRTTRNRNRKGTVNMAKAKIEYSYELYTGAPVSKVWKGLTDDAMTKRYVYGTRLKSDFKVGSPYAYLGDGDFCVVDGKILEIEPGKRLVMTRSAHWDEASSKDRSSRVTYELTPSGRSTTKLSVRHDDLDKETATYRGSVEGWPLMMSSLKSLLETGKPLGIEPLGA
jgi:uncharacterized protein YndB with AHSA1/START domain